MRHDPPSQRSPSPLATSFLVFSLLFLGIFILLAAVVGVVLVAIRLIA